MTTKGRNWFGDLMSRIEVDETGNWPDHFGAFLAGAVRNELPQPIKALSLFSGAGGLDIGFHDAGFDIVEMVEIESAFAETLKENCKPGAKFEGAVAHAIDIRDFFPLEGANYDFIIGGPPCQTFSAAGRRAAGVKGTSDPRGVLFEEYVRLLTTLRPKGFLFENVYGIVGAENGEPWRLIVNSFEEAGYMLKYRVLDTADFGVPQHRERLFIVGIRDDLAEKGIDFRFPKPTHGPDSNDLRPHNTASNALVDLEQSSLSGTAINGRWGDLIPLVPPGLNYSFFTAEMGYPRPVFAWRSKFSDFMYKADPDMPVRTVKAQGGAYTGPLSWENRHFTISEFKRLQSFPDDYLISGNRQTQIHQIGNSVPPQIGRILGISVIEQLFGINLPFQVDYLSDSEQLTFRKRKRLLSSKYAAKATKAIEELDVFPDYLLDEHVKQLNGEYVLTDNFEISSEVDLISNKISIVSSEKEEVLLLEVSDQSAIGKKFELSITKKENAKWALPFSQLVIVGQNLNKDTFTGTLKVFEKWARDCFGIEDLIQLSGYYQNESSLIFSISSNEKDEFVSLVSLLISTNSIGKILDSESLSKSLGLSKQQLFDFMVLLRSWGYEIRNSVTNPQIPENCYLIPYIFPTLNSRSTQLRKELV